MKKLFLFLVCTSTISSFAQITIPQLPTATNVNPADVTVIVQSGITKQVALSNSTGANVIIRGSAPGGGNNYLSDFFTASNTVPGQLVLTEGGGNGKGTGVAIWKFGAIGVGTNSGGQPIDFLGGINNFGNPYWYDIPFSPSNNVLFNMNYGPTKSTWEAAFPGGYSVPAAQQFWQFNNANPFGGISFIIMSVGKTNAAHGAPIGVNADGVTIYKQTFGLAIGEISDAWEPYGPLTNGYITNTIYMTAQQANSYQVLGTDPTEPMFFGYDGQRAGDLVFGQIPLLILNPTNYAYGYSFGSGHPCVSGFPLQVTNTYMPQQTNFLWSLGIDENSGTVFVTNGTLQASNLVVSGNFTTPIITKTTNYSASYADNTILLATAGTAVTLPSVTGRAGLNFTIKALNSSGSVNTTSSQKIDSGTFYTLTASNKYVSVQSDGTQWWIVGNN
jgi:hypothetical protein